MLYLLCRGRTELLGFRGLNQIGTCVGAGGGGAPAKQRNKTLRPQQHRRALLFFFATDQQLMDLTWGIYTEVRLELRFNLQQRFSLAFSYSAVPF